MMCCGLVYRKRMETKPLSALATCIESIICHMTERNMWSCSSDRSNMVMQHCQLSRLPFNFDPWDEPDPFAMGMISFPEYHSLFAMWWVVWFKCRSLRINTGTEILSAKYENNKEEALRKRIDKFNQRRRKISIHFDEHIAIFMLYPTKTPDCLKCVHLHSDPTQQDGKC